MERERREVEKVWEKVGARRALGALGWDGLGKKTPQIPPKKKKKSVGKRQQLQGANPGEDSRCPQSHLGGDNDAAPALINDEPLP